MSELEQMAALTNMPKDLALIKIENDSMMSLAAVRPRDHVAILADLKLQLATHKSFAESAMYCKPVGKDKNKKMQYARGLSVRAAEAIATSFGFNKIRVDTIPINEDLVKMEATFTDFQTGRVWSDSIIVSKIYKAYGGKTARYADDRFYNVVLKAEKSKLIRDVILRCVTPGLKSDLEFMVNELLDGFLDEKTVAKLVAQFASKGVTAEMLETHMSKKLDSLTKADRTVLLGIWTAIQDEETTVEEAFGSPADKKDDAKPEKKQESKTEALAKEVAPDASEPPPANVHVDPVVLRASIKAKVIGLDPSVQIQTLANVGMKTLDEVNKIESAEELQSILDVVLSAQTS